MVCQSRAWFQTRQTGSAHRCGRFSSVNPKRVAQYSAKVIAALFCRGKFRHHNLLKRMVGARGFEPPTPWSRTRCATRLRYAPTGRVGKRRASKRNCRVTHEDASQPLKRTRRQAAPMIENAGIRVRCLSYNDGETNNNRRETNLPPARII
jgi:hypothetical protein